MSRLVLYINDLVCCMWHLLESQKTAKVIGLPFAMTTHTYAHAMFGGYLQRCEDFLFCWRCCKWL